MLQGRVRCNICSRSVTTSSKVTLSWGSTCSGPGVPYPTDWKFCQLFDKMREQILFSIYRIFVATDWKFGGYIYHSSRFPPTDWKFLFFSYYVSVVATDSPQADRITTTVAAAVTIPHTHTHTSLHRKINLIFSLFCFGIWQQQKTNKVHNRIIAQSQPSTQSPFTIRSSRYVGQENAALSSSPSSVMQLLSLLLHWRSMKVLLLLQWWWWQKWKELSIVDYDS